VVKSLGEFSIWVSTAAVTLSSGPDPGMLEANQKPPSSNVGGLIPIISGEIGDGL